MLLRYLIYKRFLKITVNKPFSKNDPLQRKSLYFNQVGLFCFTFFILEVILDHSWTLDNLGALCGILLILFYVVFAGFVFVLQM